ncbi:MAG: ABC transporter permease [Bacilli bacterium]|nr:ABC transporter permease [Bacilli bacterium]
MKLLFINALKGIRKKKVQMIAIITLVLLSSAIYTSMNTSIDRLENEYYDYLIEQNVEEFSFTPVIDYSTDITGSEVDELLETVFVNASESEKEVVEMYRDCLTGQCELNDNVSLFYNKIETIFKKYQADLIVMQDEMDKLAEQYEFTYEIESAKVYKEDKYIYKAIVYDTSKKINIPYLIEGNYPTNDNEITVLKDFALNNDLEIGDYLTINSVDYKIVGYMFASDNIYPLISISTPFFDNKYNNIIFMNEATYQEFSGVSESVYSVKLNETNFDNRANFSSSGTEESTDNPIGTFLEEQTGVVSFGIDSILRIIRTDMIKSEFDPNRTFTEAFMYLLLGISVFVIGVITKKRIDDERLQIGVLKSLGYNTFSIATSYLVYPIIGSLIGGIFGYLIGILLNAPITKLFTGYYNLPINGLEFDSKYLFNSVLIPMLLLSSLCYIIALFMLRKKPLDLLKEGSNLKVNIFSKMVTFITKPLSFKKRFKYSLAFRSLGKLLIVSLTSLCAGLLIVLTLIGMNLFSSMIDKTFENVNYDYVVSYYTLQEGYDENADLILSKESSITSIVDSDGNEKTFDEESADISLIGLDQELKYVDLVDNDNNTLVSSLQNGIIINSNVKELLGIDIGDTITLADNSNLSYQVVGIVEEYFTSNIYIDRATLCEDLETTLSYNTKYTSDTKYRSNSELSEEEINSISSIIDFVDLKRNIENRIEIFNTVIYVIIGFASLMALIIIAVIANIIVEENKKTISLMKVMGYKNKEISNIVLNIYTPFVVIFYLLSIPIMIEILKAIISMITDDINMAIPIAISPFMAGMGLVGIMAAYYVAIAISRKALNKVPLAVALKRE